MAGAVGGVLTAGGVGAAFDVVSDGEAVARDVQRGCAKWLRSGVRPHQITRRGCSCRAGRTFDRLDVASIVRQLAS